MNKKMLLATLLGLASLPARAEPALPPPPSVEATLGAEGPEAFGALDLFLPLMRNPDGLLFLDARAAFGGEQEIEQGSLGLGYRFGVGEGWVLGINGYADYLNSTYDNDFAQISLGLEALGRDWEVHANGYLPVGSVEASVAAANAALIEAGRLVLRAGEETALHGVDAEVGYRVPFFAPDDLTQLKLFAGGYWYAGDDIEDVPGVSARLELSRAALPALGNGSRFTLVAGVTYDDELGSQGSLLARLRVPLGSTQGMTPYDPMYSRVYRANALRTSVGATGAAETALYVETGQAAGTVVNISASDNATSANARLAAAGTGALVLASGTINVDAPIQLGTGQYLLGGGGSVTVRGATSGGTATFSSNTAAATLNGTNALADVVHLADNSAIAALALRGGRDSIRATNVSGIVLRDLDIGGSAGHGITLEAVSDARIERVAIHDLAICENNTACEWSIFNPNVVSNAGIVALGVENLTLRDVTMTDLTYGLFVGSRYVEENFSFEVDRAASDLTVENLSIVNSRREGILLVGVDEATLRGITIDNTAMDRSMDLIVLQKTSNAKLSDLTLKGGINGLMFASSFSLPGETAHVTISNAFIEDTYRAGIFINPSHDLRFENVTIVSPGSYGVYFYGDAWGFAGGPVTGVSFANVSVSASADAAVYVSGPIADIDGAITTSAVPAPCRADAGSWSGTELSQSGSQSFSIGGQTMSAGTLTATCGL